MPVGPLPTAIGITTPVGSTRTTLSASPSVSHNGALADRDPDRARVGVPCFVVTSVVALSSVSRPPVGATQTESPSAAIALEAGATSPIRSVGPGLLNSVSIRPTATLLDTREGVRVEIRLEHPDRSASHGEASRGRGD